MMKRSIKVAFMILLIGFAVKVWMPGGKKPANVSAESTKRFKTETTRHSKTRTEFTEWKRNPFAWSGVQKKKETNTVSHLTVTAIMFSGEKASALIEDSIVCVGDKIGGITVKNICKDKVILTDGINDYELELQK